jgi:ADP-heptose:LPS heptosyltransferase
VRSFRAHIEDFSDTAALIAQLDLLISIDTSTAHLGPTLGIPTWVLLARSADWRWGIDSQSPWYPQSRLFRQQAAGEWQAPIDALRIALAEHFRVS